MFFLIFRKIGFDRKYLLWYYDGKLIDIKFSLCEFIFVYIIIKLIWVIFSFIFIWRECIVYV